MRRGVRGAAQVVEATGARRVYSSHSEWVVLRAGRARRRGDFMRRPTPAAGAPARRRSSRSTSWAAPAWATRRLTRCATPRERLEHAGPVRDRRRRIPDGVRSQPDGHDRSAVAHERPRPGRKAGRGCLRPAPTRSSSGPARTGWPRRSPSPAPAGRPRARGEASARRRCRSAELTLPGFVHDVCSAVHPLALASPFLRALPLAEHGLELVHPPAPLAHPLDDGSAVMLERSIDADRARARRRRRRLPAADRAARRGRRARCFAELLGPAALAAPPAAPGPLRPQRHALGRRAGRARVRGRRAPGPVRRLRAHSMLPLRAPVTAAFGLVLALAAHTVGWPIARGGSQRITDALAAYLRSLGGESGTGRPVGRSTSCRPAPQPVLLDLTPRQVLAIAGDRLPARYRRRARALSLRTWRVQDRLGARRADPVDGARGCAARAPCIWAARSTRSPRPSRPSRAGAIRAPVRAARAAEPVRPDARAGGPAHGLGLLPRAERLDARHDRGNRGPDRALRARLSATSSWLARDGQRRDRAPQRATTSAATSTAAPRTSGSSSPGPSRGRSPTPRRCRALHLLVATPPGGGVHGMCGYWAARAALG